MQDRDFESVNQSDKPHFVLHAPVNLQWQHTGYALKQRGGHLTIMGTDPLLSGPLPIARLEELYTVSCKKLWEAWEP